MSSENDNLSELPPCVSSVYRTASTEQAPERINLAVMDMARREVRTARNSKWLDAWHGPVAFIATAGLSLTLVLQMTRMDVLESPDAPSGIAPVTRIPFQQAGEVTRERVLQLEAEASRSMTSAPDMTAPDSNKTGTPSGIVDVGSNLSADDDCSDEQRADTATWWLCIEDLEKQGQTQAAERELQALLQTFPDFSKSE